MNIETIYIIEDNKFGKAIAEWAEAKTIETITNKRDNQVFVETVDAVIIFHENHDFNKEDEETQTYLSKNNKMIHKVDLNGTMVATLSNLEMWLDRNRPKSLLFLGDNGLVKNDNFSKFLEGMGK